MGYVILGLFALNQVGITGSLYQMLNHGVSTGALFLLVGVLYERKHTRDLAQFGGLGARIPVYSGFFRLMAFASLGLPGLAGFIGEFLVFVGTFPIFPIPTVIAGLGLIVSAAFLLWTIQRVLLGPLNPRWSGLPDMNRREWVSLAPLALLSVFFGVFPKPFLNGIQSAVRQLAVGSWQLAGEGSGSNPAESTPSLPTGAERP
jgi:NADH-quinone oxidoreductase subunit M